MSCTNKTNICNVEINLLHVSVIKREIISFGSNILNFVSFFPFCEIRVCLSIS